MSPELVTATPTREICFRPLELDAEALERLAERRRVDYAGAEPFPHIVLDDVFEEQVGQQILGEFAAPDDQRWIRHEGTKGKKLETDREEQLGPYTRHVISRLNSSVFLSFLEQLTGIQGLIPDPHLFGGGLHQIRPGGFLKIHADFNRHERLRLDRRLNLILFLNRDWEEAYGGHLELWDREMTAGVQRVLPVFNRVVVFSTTDFSFHGHPEPLTCPEGRTRKSLALYYYTNGRPADETGGSHTTLYRERPGESLKPSATAAWRSTLKRFAPPILVDAVRALGKSG